MLNKLEEALRFLKPKMKGKGEIGLILGSGLGELADHLEDKVEIPFQDIPHFPVSTVEGHAGRWVMGSLQNRSVIAMQGRFHFYEGYTLQEVVFPVYVMKQLGVKLLMVTNACGGVNSSFSAGDLMLISDHLNLMGDNPLIGYNEPSLGLRFPDMSYAYSPKQRLMAKQIAAEWGMKLQEGVYAGISGPNYMTSVELKMLAKLGADAVGMSTVPEVIAASHAGLEVLGLSCVTDMATGDAHELLTHEQVVEVANRTKPRFISFMQELIKRVEIR
jgi:purine-nucleoside phosphorylase